MKTVFEKASIWRSQFLVKPAFSQVSVFGEAGWYCQLLKPLVIEANYNFDVSDIVWKTSRVNNFGFLWTLFTTTAGNNCEAHSYVDEPQSAFGYPYTCWHSKHYD